MFSIHMTVDIILILTSGAAVLYCQLLSRRLKALHDLKSGVGQAIVNLSTSIKSSNEANSQIAEQAREALSSLDEALQRVVTERTLTEDVLETLDGQTHRAKASLDKSVTRAAETAEKVGSLTERARIEMMALTKAVAITNKVSMLVSSNAKRTQTHDKPVNHVHLGSESTKKNPFRAPVAEVG